VLVGVLALLLGLAAPGRRALRSYYFLIGLAFVLVQYGVVSTFSSFFGDPVSTAYAVVLLLLAGMALGSAQLPAFLGRPAKQRWGLAVIAASVSVAALAWRPVDLAFAPAALRLGVAALAVLPGAVLLGVFFPLGLRGQPARGRGDRVHLRCARNGRRLSALLPDRVAERHSGCARRWGVGLLRGLGRAASHVIAMV
jgi:hypothetical protein